MNALGKFALMILLSPGLSCSLRDPGPGMAFRVESIYRTEVPKMELLEADLLLAEKRAVVAQWRDGQHCRTWRTYSALTNPRRILVTPGGAGKEHRAELNLSREQGLKLEERLSEELARLSAAVSKGKGYRSDFSEEERRASWTRLAVEKWLNALRRESTHGRKPASQ
ncbi:hypothetical protein [Verrucomicrobium sp. BvORR106]|uniref:hypothetical protein n=1 Tax=Verrucomicrobium sp. BvORR106 TaxID=1403819 RepID=UPI00056DC087|nr:hypothetical protein [Verrucomicrobium sp. BvORR106]